jgi:hypothetical protein
MTFKPCHREVISCYILECNRLCDWQAQLNEGDGFRANLNP